MEHTKPLLSVSSLGYAYHTLTGEIPALRDINFSVNKGEFLSVVGPSGCGKSTMLSLLSGLLLPESGTIDFSGQNIGYMLQHDQLLEWRTIYQNVLLGLEINRTITPKKKELVHTYLKKYELDSFKGAKPSQLSGGMRQRAALIRTLALEPDLLLLDEPFSALDYQTRMNVANDIGAIIKKEGKTAILVTHDLAEAISLGNRVLIFTNRPGTIKTILPLEFDLSLSTFERRDTPKFNQYFNQLWREMEQ